MNDKIEEILKREKILEEKYEALQREIDTLSDTNNDLYKENEDLNRKNRELIQAIDAIKSSMLDAINISNNYLY